MFRNPQHIVLAVTVDPKVLGTIFIVNDDLTPSCTGIHARQEHYTAVGLPG